MNKDFLILMIISFYEFYSSTITQLVGRESQFTLPVITSANSHIKAIKQGSFLTIKAHSTDCSLLVSGLSRLLTLETCTS